MRGLSSQFMADLAEGFLKPIRLAAIADRDIVLSIREDAINLYLKGNSLLALSRKSSGYDLTIHEKFQVPAISALPRLSDSTDVDALMSALPLVKERVIALRRGGSEIEFEQMLIRANNAESRLATDYLIIDRQLVMSGRKGRFDLTGVYLPHGTWYREKELPLALLEIKFGLNKDIAEIHEQLRGYYDSVAADLERVAEESETLLRQQIELGLIAHTEGRLEALKRVRISRDMTRTRFAIVLVDYAPASTLLNEVALRQLPFADQVDVFRVGFGLWQTMAQPLTGTTQ